jgi:outer membrane protein OmpA-like peptidoglycan-associated protein
MEHLNLKRLLFRASILVLLGPALATANIVGTDVQNFNPTTDGLDFLSVHSSETLQPGLLNVGFFLNYAANTLAYSRDTTVTTIGNKPGDRLLGADFNMGLGLAKDWDMGISFPAILSQQLDQDIGVAKYDSKGLTEIRLNTKYRFYGDDSGGFAGVFSMNNNLIGDNPFVGQGAGPTLNYELVADTTFAEKVAAAINIGYRKRNPGSALNGVPYEPIGDQYIYSVAANYLLNNSSTKFIAEIFGSQPVKKTAFDQDRSLSTLEGLVGVKHDYSHSLAMHIGAGSQIQKSVASPEWRVYAGINYVFGPLWGKKANAKPYRVNPPPVMAKSIKPAAPVHEKQLFRVHTDILFDFDSYNIKDDADDQLREFALDLQKNGFYSLVIEGHTDSIGDAEYNRILSERRANGIKNYLTQHYDLEAKKIKVIGRGKKFPIADNGNWQGRRENRRVDFIIQR